jgi:starch synthase (maltosyl-transferring)
MGITREDGRKVIPHGRRRVVIEAVKPEIDGGLSAIKRVVGERVEVEADIFSDGHDVVRASLLWRTAGESQWHEVPLTYVINDRWRGSFTVKELARHYYSIQAWVDHTGTWFEDIRKKQRAGQDIRVDLLAGARLLEEAAGRASGEDARTLGEHARFLRDHTDPERAVATALSEEARALAEKYPDKRWASLYDKELPVEVDRRKALVSAWYEFFPRSCPDTGHARFEDCEALLPEIARMGFDIIYLPPVHPIGKSKRKGKNNVPLAQSGDPGSPWAIGSEEGGHKDINPALGTLDDFRRFVEKTRQYGLEVAMDLAFQCSPDHPYVREHPEWFTWRPDGSVQHAENPPKKYEDIIPLNFESENWEALWEELRSVLLHWVGQGIRIFRVDNPHTKPFGFWRWLIEDVKKRYPETIFLSEAFTRPKVMYLLAKIGFTQSYTYFTWRNTRGEIVQYLTDLTRTEVREFLRPNFWTNTPDILPEILQYGGRSAFLMRLVLAATLSSSYGVYGPPFELTVSEAMPGKEEYLDSEKYMVKKWDWDAPGNIKDFIAQINRIRRDNPALQSTYNVSFHETDNEKLIFYMKVDEEMTNILLIVVNLDPYNAQSGRIRVPATELELRPENPYLVHDLISDEKYIWYGEWNFVRLDPRRSPAHIFRVLRRLRREADFDYFM